MKNKKLFRIARVAHEVHRAYCAALGDHSIPAWDAAPVWQVQSAIYGASFLVNCPEAGPEDVRTAWLAERRSFGWKCFPDDDADKKENPRSVSYGDLPREEKEKDYIFLSVVRAMSSL